MWKLSDTTLMERIKQTNTTLPHSDYITDTEFPEQNLEFLNTEMELEYRNYYKYNLKDALEKPAVEIIDGVKVSLRPHDDPQFMEYRELVGPDYDDASDTYTQTFKIVRCDLAEPNVFIAISADYDIIAVGSTALNSDGIYKFLDTIFVYPIQISELFNQPLQSHYMDSNFINDVYIDCLAIRVDGSNPSYSVLMELLDDNVVRFVLGDEVTIISNELPNEFISYLSIPDYRKSILEGKVIYGTV